MIEAMSPASRTIFVRGILLVVAYDTAIALFLTALTRYGLWTNLLYANAIGASIYVATRGPGLLKGDMRVTWTNGLLGIPAGFGIGFFVATRISGFTLAELIHKEPESVTIGLIAAILFGVLGTWHLRSEARLQEAREEARAERFQRTEQEALMMKTELALLQAQIEPHFLFNTLSNVVGLVDTQPAVACRMLLDLTTLLRVSLARTRQHEVTLDKELELLRAYLGIMAVRMGERLQWRIEADPETLAVRLPPLLVQPLVENAIRHGIEPIAAGGELSLSCRFGASFLVIEITNTGNNFAFGAPEGVGIANVRRRLSACFGERAALDLEPLAGGGLLARIRLPVENHEPTLSNC